MINSESQYQGEKVYTNQNIEANSITLNNSLPVNTTTAPNSSTNTDDTILATKYYVDSNGQKFDTITLTFIMGFSGTISTATYSIKIPTTISVIDENHIILNNCNFPIPSAYDVYDDETEPSSLNLPIKLLSINYNNNNYAPYTRTNLVSYYLTNYSGITTRQDYYSSSFIGSLYNHNNNKPLIYDLFINNNQTFYFKKRAYDPTYDPTYDTFDTTSGNTYIISLQNLRCYKSA